MADQNDYREPRSISKPGTCRMFPQRQDHRQATQPDSTHYEQQQLGANVEVESWSLWEKIIDREKYNAEECAE
ncbi:hypothetical protein PSCICN_33260 [Pseudomonas cichorii]|nr:hypothetical protein PSCICN_33260 [Pseudomonas cichorii]